MTPEHMQAVVEVLTIANGTTLKNSPMLRVFENTKAVTRDKEQNLFQVKLEGLTNLVRTCNLLAIAALRSKGSETNNAIFRHAPIANEPKQIPEIVSAFIAVVVDSFQYLSEVYPVVSVIVPKVDNNNFPRKLLIHNGSTQITLNNNRLPSTKDLLPNCNIASSSVFVASIVDTIAEAVNIILHDDDTDDGIDKDMSLEFLGMLDSYIDLIQSGSHRGFAGIVATNLVNSGMSFPFVYRKINEIVSLYESADEEVPTFYARLLESIKIIIRENNIAIDESCLGWIDYTLDRLFSESVSLDQTNLNLLAMTREIIEDQQAQKMLMEITTTEILNNGVAQKCSIAFSNNGRSGSLMIVVPIEHNTYTVEKEIGIIKDNEALIHLVFEMDDSGEIITYINGVENIELDSELQGRLNMVARRFVSKRILDVEGARKLSIRRRVPVSVHTRSPKVNTTIVGGNRESTQNNHSHSLGEDVENYILLADFEFTLSDGQSYKFTKNPGGNYGELTYNPQSKEQYCRSHEFKLLKGYRYQGEKVYQLKVGGMRYWFLNTGGPNYELIIELTKGEATKKLKS